MPQSQKDLGWYYRETDTTDGNEQTAAHDCGMTPDGEMNLHWRIDAKGCERITEPQPVVSTVPLGRGR